MRHCPVGKRMVRYAVGLWIGVAVGLCVAQLGCRTAPIETEWAAPSRSGPVVVSNDVAPHADVPILEPADKDGRVVDLRVSETGEIYWDGEAIDSRTLQERLATLGEGDAVVWSGGAPNVPMTPPQRSIFESVVKLGLRTVWVQQNDGANSSADEAGRRPIVVNTKHIREALQLYDRLKGNETETRRLFPADVVVRFEPDAQQGYILRRVELGVVGESLWIVHEALNESESATSIQFKKEW